MKIRITHSSFFTSLILMLWVIGIFYFFAMSKTELRSNGIEKAYFSYLINKYEENYLEKLRDTHLGCKTLNYRNPEIVFFGDSHTYAGWDFSLLQKALSKKIGVCALSGAFPENLDDFLSILGGQLNPPKTIVFGIQPRMFWQVEERTDQIIQARQMIYQIPQAKENLVAIFKKQWNEIDKFIESSSIKDKQKNLLGALNKIDNAQIDLILNSKNQALHSKNWWLEHGSKETIFPENRKIANSICKKIKALKISLVVVYIPESRWLVQHYTNEQKQSFLEAANQFGECANVNLDFFNNEGLENKYYINRQALENYPYDIWNNIQHIQKWVSENESERRWTVFDADHLNVGGAKYFTEQMIPFLQNNNL